MEDYVTPVTEGDDKGGTAAPGDVVDVAKEEAGVEVGSTGQAKEGLSAEVQAAIDRRIGKITAKLKAAEERAEARETELKVLRDRSDSVEEARLAHLGVPAQFYEAAEREELVKAESEAARAEDNALFFAGKADAGEEVVVNGRSYTPEQCRRFSLDWARKAGAAEGVRDSIVGRARRLMMDRIRKLEEKPSVKVAGKVSAAPDVPVREAEDRAPGGVPVVVDAGKRVVLNAAPRSVAEAKRMFGDEV